MKNVQLLKRINLLLLALCTFPFAFAQITVGGKVVDELNEPIIGANITLKGEKKGTITDVNGQFSISVPKQSSVLVISFIGYATKEVTVGNKKTLLVELKEDGVTLDEVVAVGYATVKKSDLTGSVAKVDMTDLTKSQVLSFDQALGGRVAGVQVVSSDGQPGAETNIVIRGSNTISDASDGTPLYVIDGFATEDANPASLNPNDIESIDVLKDASATAIYGARGANGVIIITTKRGTESAPRVTYDGYVTYQASPKNLKLLQGQDYVAWQNEILSASDMADTYYRYDEALGRNRVLEDYANLPSTDWQNEVFRAAPMTSHHLSLTGGTKTTKYSSSISYYNQQGVIINSSYESLKARVTLDQQISKSVKAGVTVNFSNNISKGSAPSQGGGGDTQYFLYQVLAYRPLFYSDDDEDEDALLQKHPNYPYNPLKTIQNTYDKTRSRQLSMNAYLNWMLTKDLTFRATFAYNWRMDRRETYDSAETYWGDPRYSSRHSNGKFNFREWDGWSNEYTLTYKKRFGAHNLTAMLGGSLNSRTSSNLGANSVMVPWDALGFWGLSSGTPEQVTTNNFVHNMASYFGRVNYDWRSRYLLTATVRADGTSRFPYHKWGYFPSGSFGWRVSEEAFMAPTKEWMSNLKLRVGWGATGNCNTYKDYPSQLLYLGDQSYAFNNSIDHPAIYISQMPNKDMKWETTYQTNIGLDFGFFQNRITGEIDFYNKETKDLLLNAEVPLSIGFDKIQQNIGSIRNRGLEFSINTVNFAGGKKGEFKWTTNFNISFNKSKITGLSGDQDFLVTGIQYPTIKNLYIARIGQPLSQMYGYVYDGVYQYEDFNEVSPGVFVLKDGIPNNTEERNSIKPGDMKLRDINGDGKVSPEDQTVIGNGLPIHTGGFTNNFEYKGFDLNVFFQWSYGNDVVNYNRHRLEDLRGRHLNQLASAMNHWTPRVYNSDGSYTDGNYTNYLCAVERSLDINTSRVVEDASFLRLKNVQLGYNFPVKLIKRLGISSLRVYVSGQNLWTWTKYTGYDPEVSTRNSALTRGFDYSSYPKTTSYTFGVKLGL